MQNAVKNFYLSFPYRDQVVRLLGLSVMCVGLLGFRMYHSGSIRFMFLSWNLFLAWVPLGIALLTYRRLEQGRLRGHHGLAGWAAWLLFFPNAPYIITDLLHLTKKSAVPIWYDSLMVFSYALVGLLAGLLSLHLIHRVMDRRLGRMAARLVVTFSLLLAGFGVYLGRFERWNSWDLLTNPVGLLGNALEQLTNPTALRLTVVFALMLTLIYYTFVGFLQSPSGHVAAKHSS
jgi:uncharacterized membrane protein